VVIDSHVHSAQTDSVSHPGGAPMALSSEVKRPMLEVAHSILSSAEVKNAWSPTSTTPYTSMTWCLTEHMDNFTCCILHSDLLNETIYRQVR
jgi:hypothetical protein